jgi:RecA-family ATPase
MSAPARIRPLNMAALMAQPERPTAWRIDRFAQDGALTILAAKGGVGKSWLGIAACAAVQAGRPLADIAVERGRAVYVDAEMGAMQMVDRFRQAGLPADAFSVLDALGLDIGAPGGVALLTDELRTTGARLVVLDSLRKLAPTMRENESDDMGHLLAALTLMARSLNAAVVVIHHAGHGERFLRGSAAIRDQADVVYGLERDGDILRLSCDPSRGGKFRLGVEPSDRTLRLAVGVRAGAILAPDGIVT